MFDTGFWGPGRAHTANMAVFDVLFGHLGPLLGGTWTHPSGARLAAEARVAPLDAVAEDAIVARGGYRRMVALVGGLVAASWPYLDVPLAEHALIPGFFLSLALKNYF